MIFPAENIEQRENKAQNLPKVRLTQPVEMQVQLRPSSAFQTPGDYLTQTLVGNQAYLIPLPNRNLQNDAEVESYEESPFPLPTSKPVAPRQDIPPLLARQVNHQPKIYPASVFAPVDIVVMNPQGYIIEVWPRIVMSNLSKPLTLASDSYAVLYLASNRAAELGIHPQVRIGHTMFQPPKVRAVQ